MLSLIANVPAPATRPTRRAGQQLGWLLAALFCCAFIPTTAQTPTPTPQITEAQAQLYERWRANIKQNQRAAYEAGKEYVTQYPHDEYATHVRRWLALYEPAVRKARFKQLLYQEKNYTEAYAVGQQVRADEPENVKVLLELASAAYLATGAGDDAVRADALALARASVSQLETGQQAADWQPFANAADAGAYFNFVIGDLLVKTAPGEAVAYLRKAALSEGAIRHAPTVYARLAAAYAKSEYEPLAQDFAARFAAKEATPESQAALAKIFPVLDRMIDAYARAVAFSQNDPQYNGTRPRWLQELTALYQARHDNATTGLDELLTSVIKQPLPEANLP